ncbi:hypothetical protein M885DRAFT_508956 [Pelagophyceae sp. CCMP2097]|nr:hypothetical protein M885DRAFT_508956 [Pelagophyceae sp. CCMP2097]
MAPAVVSCSRCIEAKAFCAGGAPCDRCLLYQTQCSHLRCADCSGATPSPDQCFHIAQKRTSGRQKRQRTQTRPENARPRRTQTCSRCGGPRLGAGLHSKSATKSEAAYCTVPKEQYKGGYPMRGYEFPYPSAAAAALGGGPPAAPPVVLLHGNMARRAKLEQDLVLPSLLTSLQAVSEGEAHNSTPAEPEPAAIKETIEAA